MQRPKLLLVFCFCVVVSFSAATPSIAAKKHANIEFAKVDGIPLHLDLYLPDEADTPPKLIVWIHGGGWQKGSKDRCPIVWMNEKNYAVASVQYRLSDKASFPAQIHDCKGAIRWLRAHADEYGFDAEKIGVAGISAGGHLVALLGTSGDVKELEGEVGGNLGQSSRVQAVLDMCGPSDFLLRLKDNPQAVNRPDSPVSKLLGGPVGEKRELAKLASPAHHVTNDDPPLLIYHGTKDPLVNPTQSKHLRDLYQQAGLDVSLVLIANGGHVPKEFWDRERREMALQFFTKQLK